MSFDSGTVSNEGSVVATVVAAAGADADPRVAPGLGGPLGISVSYNGHAYVKTGPNDTDWEQIAQGAFSESILTRSFFRARAAVLAGLGRGGEFFDDFSCTEETGAFTRPIGWYKFNVGGTGAFSLPEAHVWRADTGATDSSACDALYNAPLMKNPLTQAFYWATRLRIPTTVDAQTIAQLALTDASGPGNEIRVGFKASAHATNYSVWYDLLTGPHALDLGAAVDTGWHYIEVYNNGDGKLRAQLDMAAEVAAGSAQADPTDQLIKFFRYCRNGTTAASQKLDIAWTMLDYPHV